jgi:hypothetical protein
MTLEHSFSIEEQPDGTFTVRVVGGHIETIVDCRTRKEAESAGLYAVAKNKEYVEEAERDAKQEALKL